MASYSEFFKYLLSQENKNLPELGNFINNISFRNTNINEYSGNLTNRFSFSGGLVQNPESWTPLLNSTAREFESNGEERDLVDAKTRTTSETGNNEEKTTTMFPQKSLKIPEVTSSPTPSSSRNTATGSGIFGEHISNEKDSHCDNSGNDLKTIASTRREISNFIQEPSYSAVESNSSCDENSIADNPYSTPTNDNAITSNLLEQYQQFYQQVFSSMQSNLSQSTCLSRNEDNLSSKRDDDRGSNNSLLLPNLPIPMGFNFNTTASQFPVNNFMEQSSVSQSSSFLSLPQSENEEIETSKNLVKFSSHSECKNNQCKIENLREHFHCFDLPCIGKVISKKEEIVRHLKWHKKRNESLNYGFLRFSSSDDCTVTFGANCPHNKRQTHYHCFQPNCDKVYTSTSDVQMHSNYHKKDTAIFQEGFQRYRATEECNADYCVFSGQRTTHFHCRRDNCQFTFKNKADMEKHKSYHIRDSQLARDGFKKFLKSEACPFPNCKFSRVCNHVHCVRENCSYVLHSTGQLLSHKRKHERIDAEQAYRKYKKGTKGPSSAGRLDISMTAEQNEANSRSFTEVAQFLPKEKAHNSSDNDENPEQNYKCITDMKAAHEKTIIDTLKQNELTKDEKVAVVRAAGTYFPENDNSCSQQSVSFSQIEYPLNYSLNVSCASKSELSTRTDNSNLKENGSDSDSTHSKTNFDLTKSFESNELLNTFSATTNFHLAQLALFQQNPFFFQACYPFLSAHSNLSDLFKLSSNQEVEVGGNTNDNSLNKGLNNFSPLNFTNVLSACSENSPGEGTSSLNYDQKEISSANVKSPLKSKRKRETPTESSQSPPSKKVTKHTKELNYKIFKDEPVPEGYLKFKFNEDCNFPNCGYRNHQSHFHCCRSDCFYSFCDKTRFVQHTARHERLDKLMGDDFKQYRANMKCGYENCSHSKNTVLGENSKSSHFHCLKCNFTCSDTNKVVAHRRQHSKAEYIQMVGFRKISSNERCTISEGDDNQDAPIDECNYSLKQTHYHCLQCNYSVLSRAQLNSHKHRTTTETI